MSSLTWPGPSRQVSLSGMLGKERNKIIFKNEKVIPLRLFDLILKQLRETVSIIVRILPKNSPSEIELRTLR